MEQAPFDHLTRMLGRPTSRRDLLRIVSKAAVATFIGAIATADTASATVGPASYCEAVGSDGFCPPGDMKVPMPGFVSHPNGCGAEGSNFRPPQGYGDANYYPDCSQHDTCYDNCSIAKGSCDQAFFTDLLGTCAAAYSGVTSILNRAFCFNQAYVFYKAVGTSFGQDAWVSAQQKACTCMRSQVYCGCTHTCYLTPDVQVCLDACPGGLGCLATHCGPATLEQCPC